MNKIPKRKDIPAEYRWRLEDIFTTQADWEKSAEAMPKLLKELSAYRGRLENPDDLLQCLTKRDEIDRQISALFAYARMMSDTDTANAEYQGLYARALPLLDTVQAAEAFIEPELLALPEEQIRGMSAMRDGLQKYQYFFQELLREKPHILSPEKEAFLARTGELRAQAQNTYTTLTNADMKFPDTLGEDGKLTPLSESRYMQFLRSTDRRVRKDAFTKLFSSYLSLRGTFASLYQGSIKASQFLAEARHYDTMEEMALDANHIPLSVYDTTIRSTHEHLDLLHRYTALKKKILGVSELHPYDLYVPLGKPLDRKFPIKDGVRLIERALAPLGRSYLTNLRHGLEDGWIDLYENENKRSGAYSWGVYGVHPFILTSYRDDYESVSTLIHELGHSMHSFYSNASQPYCTADYTIFCAEVASTTNENLLLESMLTAAEKKKEKRFFLNAYLEQIRTTVYRQVLFAEFELRTHAAVEKGQPITADFLEQLWLELNRTYYGEDLVLDDVLRAEWSRIPHFYRPFYVYQYATGYAAALTLANRLRSGGEKERQSYLDYLSSGDSADSITLLRRAGVDMTTSAPFDATFAKFEECLEAMEALL